jgi:hypothetical protein
MRFNKKNETLNNLESWSKIARMDHHGKPLPNNDQNV